jgi:CheY-like chemotaxis protein
MNDAVQERKPKILAVDDEAFNLDILQTDLEDNGYEVIRAEDGLLALERLAEHQDIDIIILDRMMPNMDGMQVIRELKGNPLYRNIPIIMQTAAGQSQQVKEGLQAGVYYYLIKPFEPELLLSIVRNALKETDTRREAAEYATTTTRMHGLVNYAQFRFRTLKDVRNLAYYIAGCCPRPEVVIYGLNELMINAVEHGNLGITYLEKLELVMENRWQEEVERRLALPENAARWATLTLESTPEIITITIKDEGKGFDWKAYMDFDPLRLSCDPHGKGIAITRVTSFPNLEYRENGSEVVCRIPTA